MRSLGIRFERSRWLRLPSPYAAPSPDPLPLADTLAPHAHSEFSTHLDSLVDLAVVQVRSGRSSWTTSSMNELEALLRRLVHYCTMHSNPSFSVSTKKSVRFSHSRIKLPVPTPFRFVNQQLLAVSAPHPRNLDLYSFSLRPPHDPAHDLFFLRRNHPYELAIHSTRPFLALGGSAYPPVLDECTCCTRSGTAPCPPRVNGLYCSM